MGGLGSGNDYHWWRSPKKTVVEDCLSIDANHWTREGILGAGIHSSNTWRWTYPSGSVFTVNYEVDTLNMASSFVRLWYSRAWPLTLQQASPDYRVRLTATRPRFGGLRWWFVCPLIVNGAACGKRVVKLYLPPRAHYFGCRRCQRLTYRSCQESHKYDSLYRHVARDMGWDFDTVKRTMAGIGRSRP
jgi:hypothetical protein